MRNSDKEFDDIFYSDLRFIQGYNVILLDNIEKKIRHVSFPLLVQI